MSIVCKQQTEMCWQQPNSLFKQVCYWECKRNLTPCSGISRLTRALDVCVCIDVQILFLWTASVFGFCLISLQKPLLFFQDRTGIFLLFIRLPFTKCWNHSNPCRCSLSPAQTFFIATCSYLLRNLIFKKLKSAPKIFICSNHQKWESSDVTSSVCNMDLSI